MINLGVALYQERDGDKIEDLLLADGAIVRLDIKVTHASTQLSPVRFNLTFRRIRREFLVELSEKGKQLSLPISAS